MSLAKPNPRCFGNVLQYLWVAYIIQIQNAYNENIYFEFAGDVWLTTNPPKKTTTTIKRKYYAIAMAMRHGWRWGERGLARSPKSNDPTEPKIININTKCNYCINLDSSFSAFLVGITLRTHTHTHTAAPAYRRRMCLRTVFFIRMNMARNNNNNNNNWRWRFRCFFF